MAATGLFGASLGRGTNTGNYRFDDLRQISYFSSPSFTNHQSTVSSHDLFTVDVIQTTSTTLPHVKVAAVRDDVIEMYSKAQMEALGAIEERRSTTILVQSQVLA